MNGCEVVASAVLPWFATYLVPIATAMDYMMSEGFLYLCFINVAGKLNWKTPPSAEGSFSRCLLVSWEDHLEMELLLDRLGWNKLILFGRTTIAD